MELESRDLSLMTNTAVILECIVAGNQQWKECAWKNNVDFFSKVTPDHNQG